MLHCTCSRESVEEDIRSVLGCRIIRGDAGGTLLQRPPGAHMTERVTGGRSIPPGRLGRNVSTVFNILLLNLLFTV